MRNQLKAALAAGRVALGAQLRFGSPAIAELFGLAGYDWLLIDTEHAPQTPVGVRDQLQGAGCTPATALVRVAKNDPDLIKLYLDMGAAGIVAPFVNTPGEAKAGADACRYPPRGTRGWGPDRAAGYGLRSQEYTEASDREVLFAPIIESAQAIENIEGILGVEGVDSCIVGPVDLSISLGAPFEYQGAVFQRALDAVLEAAQRTGKPAGIGVYGPVFESTLAAALVARGFRLLLVGGDEWVLGAGCRLVLDQLSKLRG
jgi:2-keto-3-deoxy-L-rhamnonate aldolase RhmA